ncbi:thermonuclease family protein, partial [Candidatus Bipolaricaulota bacterium]|nr:thermonuclease family protein [Candidatus Bipolaricaulota bacterium]
MMKRALLALMLLCGVVAIGSAQRACPPATAMQVKVYKIFDGDTISIKGGERVRLLGIDTPETGEPYADLAKRFTRNLVQYKVVCLEFDNKQRDPYGRLLAYVYVETEQGLVFVNAELVRNGLARLLFIPPNYRYHDYFEALLHEAIVTRRGMWGEV